MNIFDMLKQRNADIECARENFSAERILEASARLIEVANNIDPEELIFNAAILTKGPTGLSALEIVQNEYEAQFITNPSSMYGNPMSIAAGQELAAGDTTRAANVLMKLAFDAANMRWGADLTTRNSSEALPKI